MLVTLKGQRINDEQISVTPHINSRLENVTENSKSVMRENVQTNKTKRNLIGHDLLQQKGDCVMIAQFLNIFRFSSKGHSTTSCFSRNFKNSVFRLSLPAILLNADNGVLLEKSHQTGYLLSLSRDLQRAENYIVFSHVLL